MRTSHEIAKEIQGLTRILKRPNRSKRLQRLVREFREALRREGTPKECIEVDVFCLTTPRTIEYA